MKDELIIHNLFKDSAERFRREDPNLCRAARQPFSYVSPLIHSLNFQQPGVFLLTGGRQVGKTTLLKQWIARMLSEGSITPDRIVFMAGELIRDDAELRRDITTELTHEEGLQIIIIDEVNYVKDWDKAVKFLVDSGALDQTALLLTGSDSAILREAMKRFAGRRGNASQVDFVFHPLSFAETVLLKEPALKNVIDACRQSRSNVDTPEYRQNLSRLEPLFEEYLQHGGYLTAISDWMRLGKIETATFRTYADWLRGDMLKHNKQEKYLFEILRGILRTYASQVSWISLSKDLSIEHHKTVSDYATILEDMHAVRIVEALAEHKLDAAPKKAKKLYFQDPFIYHTAEYMLESQRSDVQPALAETVAVMHYARWHEKTFYIKGDKGEVDIAYIQGNQFFPVEVKWSRNIRPEELKQIMSYSNGLILGRVQDTRSIMDVPCVPLIRDLLSSPCT
jgi:predicted AAA+ superfamily ATPase